MSWKANVVAHVDPEEVYDLLRKHRLEPRSIEIAVDVCRAMGKAKHYEITGEKGEHIAHAIVSSVAPGASADLDLIPVPRYFRNGSGFEEPFREAMWPILEHLFSELGLNRITSMVPASRSRTRRALKALGFKHEGRMRKAVEFVGSEPEDVYVLGLLREDMFLEVEDGTV